MSKAKLIELIKMSDHDLEYAIADFTLPEGGLDAFRVILTQALKEQDRDTRYGCANAISKMKGYVRIDRLFQTSDGVILRGETRRTCINYQDKDLKRL